MSSVDGPAGREPGGSDRGPRPPARGTPAHVTHSPLHPRHWGPRRTLAVAAAVTLGAIAVIAAVAWYEAPAASPSGPSYPNPNPGNVPILGVQGQINFTGSSTDYLTLVGGSDLCPQCPVVPSEDERYTPPVAGAWFFLNVTNLGAVYHTLDAFRLVSPTYGGAPVFLIRAVFCCGPSYGEAAESVGFTPGQTIGLELFVQATSIPATASSGIDLSFYLLSAD